MIVLFLSFIFYLVFSSFARILQRKDYCVLHTSTRSRDNTVRQWNAVCLECPSLFYEWHSNPFVFQSSIFYWIHSMHVLLVCLHVFKKDTGMAIFLTGILFFNLVKWDSKWPNYSHIFNLKRFFPLVSNVWGRAFN